MNEMLDRLKDNNFSTDEIKYQYESVLANGFYFDGGKVVEAYYYPKAKEVWFVLSTIDFTLRRNFSKKSKADMEILLPRYYTYNYFRRKISKRINASRSN